MTKPGQKVSEASKERARQRSKKWRQEHLEQAKSYDAAYYQANKKRLATYANDRYHRLKTNDEFRRKQALRQHRYWQRQLRKRQAEEAAIAREMALFQQDILAAR